MIDKSVIGKIIKKLRKEKGFTQEQFAEKINLSTNYLSKVERGMNTPNVETFFKMAEILDFTLEDFGIKQKSKESINTEKEELLKLILSSSSKDIYVYTKFIKFINAPTRLEFLTSISLVQQFEGLDVNPNYAVDDEGLPTFTNIYCRRWYSRYRMF